MQGRPTYKKRGSKEFLFWAKYAAGDCWLVGADTSQAGGWWKATSDAMTPGAITEAWQTHDGSGEDFSWVYVRAAKIVKRR